MNSLTLIILSLLVFALGRTPVHLAQLSSQVGRELAGGAVSLAVLFETARRAYQVLVNKRYTRHGLAFTDLDPITFGEA